VRTMPRYFAPLTAPAAAGFRLSPDQDDEMHVYRAPLENHFTYVGSPKKWIDEVPYRTSRTLLLKLLGDTLRRAIVGVVWHPRPGQDAVRILHGLPVDSLYRRMLRVSDNFLAEQLLLMTSTQVGYRDSLSGQRAIRQLLKNQLKDLPDHPDWVDGSGLSRLNLLTPRTLTALLCRLHQQVPERRLLSLLAAGTAHFAQTLL
jgi:D-alanyl-D-alanine carboxypeptidase/D-alanyl-D-alanine-endopeptidase (penicillin-binding protein 4)